MSTTTKTQTGATELKITQLPYRGDNYPVFQVHYKEQGDNRPVKPTLVGNDDLNTVIYSDSMSKHQLTKTRARELDKKVAFFLPDQCFSDFKPSEVLTLLRLRNPEFFFCIP